MSTDTLLEELDNLSIAKKDKKFYCQETGQVIRSHYVRVKDGVIFNYGNIDAESRGIDFKLMLNDEDQGKVLSGEEVISEEKRRAELKRMHDETTHKAILDMTKVMEKVVKDQANLHDQFDQVKKEGAMNLDRTKIVTCETYASGLTKEVTHMTSKEIVYAAFHKFGSTLNPYQGVNELKREYRKLLDDEKDRLSGIAADQREESDMPVLAEPSVAGLPEGLDIEAMGEEELAQFCYQYFEKDLPAGESLEVRKEFVNDLIKKVK